MLPVGVNGDFRHSFIYSLQALRNKRNLILDCCEVFVNDPLLDWVKIALKKKSSKNLSGGIYKIYFCSFH